MLNSPHTESVERTWIDLRIKTSPVANQNQPKLSQWPHAEYQNSKYTQNTDFIVIVMHYNTVSTWKSLYTVVINLF